MTSRKPSDSYTPRPAADDWRIATVAPAAAALEDRVAGDGSPVAPPPPRLAGRDVVDTHRRVAGVGQRRRDGLTVDVPHV